MSDNNKQDPILDAIKELGDQVNTTIGEVKTDLQGQLDGIKETQDKFQEDLDGVKADVTGIKTEPVNAPKPRQVIQGEPKDLGNGYGEVYGYEVPRFNTGINTKTKLGFSDEQNEAFKAYMTYVDDEKQTYAWCKSVGLTDPHIYSYHYEDGSIKSVTMTNVKGGARAELLAEKLPDGSIKQMSGLTPAAGGILIPQDHLRRIIAKRDEMSIMRPLGSDVYRTGLRVVPIPVENTKQAKFTMRAELAAYAEDTPDFTPKEAHVKNWGKIIRIAEEMAADEQSGLIPWLMSRAGDALGLTENEQFFVGTGDGITGPQGAIPGAGADVTAAANNAIAAADIFGLFYNNVDYLITGVTAFAMHPSSESAVRQLRGDDFDFTGKEWVPGTVQGTNTGRIRALLGQPLGTTKEIATVAGSAKSAIFGEFNRGYMIVERMGMEVRLLRETYAATGEIAYRFNTRFTGLVTQAEALCTLTHPA